MIEDARDHGLMLGDNGKLYDGKRGQSLPDGVAPMPVLTEDELTAFPEPTPREVVGFGVRRYRDMMAVAAGTPCPVIGEQAIIRDRPGFEVDFLGPRSIPEAPYETDRHEVLMVMRGHWRLSWRGGSVTLAPGDTCAQPPDLARVLVPSMSGEASLYRVRNTDDPAGPTWRN